MGTRIDNRLANFCAELNDRLVHLRLDLLFKDNFPVIENLLDVRPELARLRIDNREFLLDSEGKCMLLHLVRSGRISEPSAKSSAACLQKTNSSARFNRQS